MKQFKLIISVIVILLLLAVSTVGMFALPANNIDDRKANVAVVNEDNGATINGKEVVYGTDFSKLFSRNTDGKYEVTSRTAALEGLNNGKYDLAVIVPSNFTIKAMTYDSKDPEPAFLEYIKSPTSSQIESLKSEVVSKVLKETANKTLVETFTFEILKTMQEMQGKSLDIISNETEYQTKFKDNVEAPVAESMANFNQLLGELASQQAGLSHFDSIVNNFKTAIQSQDEAEKKHLADFEALKKRHEETKAALAQTSTDYNSTLKLMNDDTYRKTLTDAQQAGVMNIQALIDNVKLNTVKLELQIKAMEDYRAKMDNLKSLYDEVATTGVVTERNATDGVNDGNDTKINTLKSKLENLMNNDSVMKAIKDVTNSETAGPSYAKAEFEKSFGAACGQFPHHLKSMPLGYSIERFTDVKNFCEKSGMLKILADADKIPDTVVTYEKEVIDFWSGLSESIDTTKMGDFVSGTYKRYNNATGQIEAQGAIAKNSVTTFDGTVDEGTTVHTSLVYKESVSVQDGTEINTLYTPSNNMNMYEGTVTYKSGSTAKNTKIFTDITPKVIDDGTKNLIDNLRPKQKEAIESIQQIEALSLVYYGKALNTLLVEYTSDINKVSTIPSDVTLGINGQATGVAKFRPYANIIPIATITDESGNTINSAWNGSLIAQLEKVFDERTLKVEITKAFAKELSANTHDVILQMDGYIDVLKERTDGALDTSKLDPQYGIYTDATKTQIITPDVSYYLDREISAVRPGSYNEVIANMMLQHTSLQDMSKNLTAFDTNFQTWLDNYNKIPAEITKVTTLRENEGQLVVQLEENQKQLLTGIVDLQKQVDAQLESTKQVITDAEKLKSESDASKAKIEQHAAKLQDTKKKFDDTVKDNGDFVNGFVQKYTSAQNGGADNERFYQNYAKPVELNGKDVYNSNSLVAFFIILLITIFALVIAYFYNQWRIRRVAASEHDEVSMFAGLATQLILVTLTALAAAGIIGYIGMQALDVKDVNMLKWFAIIAGIAVAFTMTFYMLLLRFKTYGMLAIGLMMLLYFITNGALGLNIMKNSTLSWLQWINPLIYFEKPLQSVIFQQPVNLLPIFTVLILATIGSIIIIYILQPLVHRQEMKEAKS